MICKMKDGKIIVDGREFEGNNVSIVNGNVTIDGVSQDMELSNTVNVVIIGHAEILENHSGSVKATEVGNIKTGSGSVSCENVSGNITTGSGDVFCGSVSGNVSTGSGDVFHR